MVVRQCLNYSRRCLRLNIQQIHPRAQLDRHFTSYWKTTGKRSLYISDLRRVFFLGSQPLAFRSLMGLSWSKLFGANHPRLRIQ